jgi:hypothetical protein
VSQEGGKALILSMLGYPPDAGFAIGLIRRIKEMVWVALGLAGLTAHRMLAGHQQQLDVAPAILRITEAQPGEPT